MQKVSVIDSHTGGEPTRVVVSGGPDLGGGNITERLAVFRDQHDRFRSAVVGEPRGSDVIVGALLTSPSALSHAAGVIFFNNVGYIGMCGHGTIGLVTTLAYLGRIGPGEHHIETPVGTVGALLHPDGRVSVRNVPSYRLAKAVKVEVPGIGAVTGDVAWGGNNFFLVHNEEIDGPKLTLANTDALTARAWRVRHALTAAGIHGRDGGETQRRVVDAYRKAFPNKKILFRNADGYVGQQTWVGFHDDYFPEDTGTKEDWNFLAGIRRAGRGENWRRAAIGGEMIPEKSKNALKWLGSADEFALTLARATDAHFTWVGPYCPALEAPPNPEFSARCQTLVRRMGYQFRLLTLRHDAVLRAGKPLMVELRGVNEGSAPFYYPWQIKFALIDASGRIASQIPVLRADTRDWQPGSPFTLAEALPLPLLASGRYTLAFGIIAPWRNVPPSLLLITCCREPWRGGSLYRR